MPKNLFEKGNPGKPRGSTNHITKTVKEVVLRVFLEDEDNPDHNLAAFKRKYPVQFYTALAAKIIPTEIRNEIFTPEGIKLQFLTDPGCKPMEDDRQDDKGDPGVLGQQTGL